MKFNRLIFAVLALIVAFPSQTIKAQTTTASLRWNYMSDTVANVATYAHFVQVNSTVVTTAPTCVQAGANVNCQVPITPLGGGSHTIIVEASRNNMTARTTITGVLTNNAPKNPDHPGYQVNVTINIP